MARAGTVDEVSSPPVFSSATAVAGALSAAMDDSSSGKKALQVGGTRSLTAFDAYLRGRELFESHIDEASERAALAKLEQAIAIDPDYAAARALRSRMPCRISTSHAASMRSSTRRIAGGSSTSRFPIWAPISSG